MDRKETTKLLSELAEKMIAPHGDTRIYWAREITFDYGTSHQIRVDYMKFKPVSNTTSGIEKGDFYCYEVKSSTADFHSKNGHNFIGDLNYYIMPEDVYAAVAHEIPHWVGVCCPTNWKGALKVVKKAKRQDRTRPVSEMLLMMFRSAARDRTKSIGIMPDYEGDGVDDEGKIIYDTWICPKCGKKYELDYEKHKYCPECGQAIMWVGLGKEE